MMITTWRILWIPTSGGPGATVAVVGAVEELVADPEVNPEVDPDDEPTVEPEPPTADPPPQPVTSRHIVTSPAEQPGSTDQRTAHAGRSGPRPHASLEVERSKRSDAMRRTPPCVTAG